MRTRVQVRIVLVLILLILIQISVRAMAEPEISSACPQKTQQIAKSPDQKGPPATPPHDMGPKISAWVSHEAGKETDFTAVTKKFIKNIRNNGGAIVVLGGTSVNMIFPEAGDSAKAKFSRLPKSMAELVGWTIDAAQPMLSSLAAEGRFKNGDAPILVVPMPGYVKDNLQVVLPGNFGAIGNIEGKPVNQKARNHAQLTALADLLRVEMVKRAEELGIPKDQVEKAIIYLANDALPIGATAAYTKLRPGQRASIFFIGTGTGSAKISLGKDSSFNMLSSEESQTKLGEIPEALAKEIPKHLLLGARLARATKSRPIDVEDLTLENVTGGGRDFDDEDSHYKVANHLIGADTITLSLLLDEKDMPQWVKDRVGRNYQEYRKKVLKSLDLDPKSLSQLLRYGTKDLALIQLVQSGKFISRKDLKELAKDDEDQKGAVVVPGSVIADKIIRSHTFTQGLVAGYIALNVGDTPSGNVIPVDLVYGRPNRDGQYTVRIIARASAGLGDWKRKKYFKEALDGVETAKSILLKDDDYRRKLENQGFKTPKRKDVTIVVDRTYSEDLTEHPDFNGLDVFMGSLRRAAALDHTPVH